jgi:uncharacterized membrane protein YjgN (DUF898 family)
MAASTRPIRYHGTGGTLLGIMLLNGLLSVLTLGIYSFWAKTKVRQYFYSETELAGDRFAWHGTGRELLGGTLKATAVIIGLSLLFTLATMFLAPVEPGQPPGTAVMLVSLGFWLMFFLLLPIAINGARRYRLSRSSWRGVRFRFTGRWADYLALVLKGTLLSVVSLGFYLPFFLNEARGFLINNARFGSLPFTYDADGKELFKAYLLHLLLTIPTLGLCWIWFLAFRHRYFWSHTSVGPATFRSTVTGGGMLALSATNGLLVVLTLGIGAPWALTRSMRYISDHLALRGDVDWSTVEQEAERPDATGEGMAEGLDVDVDVGLGM